MTARGAARVYAALLGHIDGVDLVSSARRADMAAVQFEGMDEVMGFPTTWAFGFGADLAAVSEIDHILTAFHPRTRSE